MDSTENQANIAQATNIYGTIRQNNDLIVNLSKEFNQFGGSVAETIAVGSIVNTMTQFEEISRVKILVEGEGPLKKHDHKFRSKYPNRIRLYPAGQNDGRGTSLSY